MAVGDSAYLQCTAGDLGASLFSTLDVQRIALFDMRVLNLDRHDGNILVRCAS
jgi:hypothetical protein